MSQQLQTEAQDKTQQRLARREPHPTAAPSLHGELHPMLQLQRLVGNRRVGQLIQAKRLTPDGKLLGLQRTLTVGAADDPYEQEAERVARHVLNKSDAVAANSMQRGVRVHTGSDCTQLNRSLSAQAFTVGRDIYYGAGKSPTDLSLTAHELTHVVQQTGGGTTQRKLACGEPDIFLRQGEYNPSSRAGQELLVHELTHVVQQDGVQPQRALTQ